MSVFAIDAAGWPGSGAAGNLGPPVLRRHDIGRWLRLRGCVVSGGDLLSEIIVLAECIEPDREAVWEWFRETPIHPHGKTAMQLVQAGQGSAVTAFLQRILADSGSASGISGKPPVVGVVY